MSTGTDQSATEGVGGTEEDRCAAVKRKAEAHGAKMRKRAQRERRKAAISAAPPPERCLVSARDGRIRGNTTPSVSVHTLGSTIVQGIVDPQRHHRRQEWEGLGHKMEGLFGEGLWRTTYEESAARSHRYSLQLLPVDKGSTRRKPPWMQDVVDHVQRVLTKLGILGSQHQLGAMTLLCSEKDACQQDWHCDFPHGHRAFRGKKLAKDGTVPYPVSVLIAFDPDGAELPQMRGDTIKFGQYSAVVFRGDLEHAGAAWTKVRLNWRIHMYFITGGESCKAHLKCGVPKGGRVSREGSHIKVCPARHL